MADEAATEQVLAAGGVSKRRRGASRRSPSGQRRRAPTPEPPKDLPFDPDEDLDMSPGKSSAVKRISTTEKSLVTKRSHSSPGEGRQSMSSWLTPEEMKPEPIPKYEDSLDLSSNKPAVIKRKSTTEKTMVAKRSQSSPGEGRQALSSSPTAGGSKEEHSTITKTRILPDGKKEESVVITKMRTTSDGTSKTEALKLTDGDWKTETGAAMKTHVISDGGSKTESRVITTKLSSDNAPRDLGAVKKRAISDGERDDVTPPAATIKTEETVITQAATVKKSPSKTDETVLTQVATMKKSSNKTGNEATMKKSPSQTEETVKSETEVQSAKVASPVEAAEVKSERASVESERAKVPVKSVRDKSAESAKRKTGEGSPAKEPTAAVVVEVSTKSPEVPADEEVEMAPLEISKEAKPVREAVWGPFLAEMRREWRQFVAEHDEQWDRIISQRNRCAGALLVMFIYCGLGGLVFRFTEGAFEAFYKCGVKRVKRDFVDSLWLGSHHLLEEEWKSQARRKLMELESQLHAAHEAGVTSYSGQRAWSFLNAVVYCLTVVTTIGYGHISPSTTTGRAITIVYAIFGIPMFLILLADFGKLFTRGIKFIWAFVRRVYYTGSCKKVRRTVPVQEVMKGVQLVYDFATFRRPSQMMGEVGDNAQKAPIARPEDLELQVPLTQQQPPMPTQPSVPVTNVPLDGRDPPGTPAVSTFEVDDEFNLPISVAIVILLIYIFVGATIYWTWENWGFFESFYFVFISMSTIGFGDFVPQHPMYMMASIIYLVFGLALTSMCINVVQEKLSDSFRQASAKIGATIGLRVSEEDGAVTPVPPVQIELPEVHNTISKSQST